jgi:putative toxin-antitoxin system antitoxin component (TIGR02293 family)
MADTARIKEVSKSQSTSDDLDAFIARIKSGKRGSDHLYVLLLGMKTLETKKLRREIEKGFSIRVLDHLRRSMTIPLADLIDLMLINYRTLNRRKASGRLNPEESDRVLRVSRVFGRILELFEGDQQAARHWFLSRQKALGDESPADRAKTEFGALEVERLVGRLEHGVFV